MSKPETLTPEKLHEWYLEICKRMPKPTVGKICYNKDAQKEWEDLTDGQRFLDQLMCEKILDQKTKQVEWLKKEIGNGDIEYSGTHNKRKIDEAFPDTIKEKP